MKESESKADGTNKDDHGVATRQVAGGRTTFATESAAKGLPIVGAGAPTPEELETLLEDALLLGDYGALAGLFEKRSELVMSHMPPARGPEQISRQVMKAWHDAEPYLAASGIVVQVGDVTLTVTERSANVAHRGPDRTWRYAIIVELGERTFRGTNA